MRLTIAVPQTNIKKVGGARKQSNPCCVRAGYDARMHAGLFRTLIDYI